MNWRLPASAVVLIAAATLLFGRLGHYALWDDEANTALFAQGICATGDTSAVIGHNLIAYEGGWELKNLRERYIPPLPAYVTAMSLLIFGKSALAARIPFALCGLGFFIVLTVWMYREAADGWTWGLISFALLTNVSLILYFRQARYYGLIIFFSALLAYLYLHWPRAWPGRLMIFVLAFALLASNYISFGAATCCVAADWCIWGRRCVRMKPAVAAASLFTFALAAVALLYVYDPLSVTQPAPPPNNRNELLQLWWNLRDLSVNEFCILPLLVLVPIVWIWRKDPWLLRGGLTLLIYFAAITVVEPHHSSFAQLRFLTPMIPLCVVLELRALLLLVSTRKWLAVLIGIPIFGTNVLSGSTFFHPGLVSIPLRSTVCSFLGELADPPPDPYRTTANWIDAHLPNDATICVFPRYASYPLMFHAPQAVYGWQLDYPPKAQFQNLPAIQFVGREAPQFLVIFGQEGLSDYRSEHDAIANSMNYKLVEQLPVYGKDLFRPELYLRVFSAPHFDPRRDGVFILAKR